MYRLLVGQRVSSLATLLILFCLGTYHFWYTSSISQPTIALELGPAEYRDSRGIHILGQNGQQLNRLGKFLLLLCRLRELLPFGTRADDIVNDARLLLR